MFFVIEALERRPEGLAHHERRQFRQDAAAGVLFEPALEERRDALPELQEDISHEPVADNDLRRSLQDVPALDVADKVEIARLKKRVRLLGGFVSLALLFSDIEKPDRGARDAEHLADIHASHHGELKKMTGTAVDVGARVEKEANALFRGEKRADGGPSYAFGSAENKGGRGHNRSGIAGADEGVGLSLVVESDADGDGGVFFLFEGGGGAVVHVDHLRRVDDAQGSRGTAHLAPEHIFRTNEHDLEPIVRLA